MLPMPSREERLVDWLCEMHRAGEEHEARQCPMCEAEETELEKGE